jgi:hypothetical protein
MLKDKPDQAKKVAEWLSQGVKYKSHGKVIDYAEAHDVLQLNVEKIDQNSEVWNNIWELYCRSVLFLQQTPHAAKLFESETVSLVMHIQVMQTIQQPQPQPPRQIMQSPQTRAEEPAPPSPQKPLV